MIRETRFCISLLLLTIPLESEPCGIFASFDFLPGRASLIAPRCGAPAQKCGAREGDEFDADDGPQMR